MRRESGDAAGGHFGSKMTNDHLNVAGNHVPPRDWRQRIHLWIAGALLAVALLRFAQLQMTMPFLFNDWLWFRRVESLTRIVEESSGSEAVRVSSLLIFALSRWIFGLDPRPIAAVF